MRADASAVAGSPEEAYQAKPSRYFSGARVDFVARLPIDQRASVLEIGCGTGATGALALEHKRCGRYVGVELVERAAAQAREVLTDVLVGDVERMELPWQPCEFDAVILSEVLEHLIEPWTLLRRLKPYLRPGGLVLASSPNIAHWRVLRELALGRFNLADQGVFDRTHMRWFTPATFEDLFESCGYRVNWVGPVTAFGPKARLLSHYSGGRLDHLLMTQISIEATRAA